MTRQGKGKSVRPYSIGSGGKIVHNYQVDSVSSGFLLSTSYDWERFLVHSRSGPVGNPPKGGKRRLLRTSDKKD